MAWLALLLVVGTGMLWARQKVAPEDAETLWISAEEARSAGRIEEAVQLYRRLVEVQPGHQQGWWYLCTTSYDLQQWSDTAEAATSLTARWPDYGPGYAMLGLALLRLGDYPRALEMLHRARAVGLGGNEALQRVVRYHGAILLIRLGWYEAAFQALKGFAYRGERTSGILDAYGLTILRLPYLPWEIPVERRELVREVGSAAFDWESGRREQAREAFTRILASHPDESNLHYSYGALLLYVDHEAALSQFLRDLELNPTNLPALLQVALEYIRRGEFEKAKPFAERAVEVDPSSPSSQFALGQVLLETGQTEEAVRRLEKAVELGPLKPETHFVLGRAYQRAGRQEDARRHLQEFERLNRLQKEAEDFLSRDETSQTGSGIP
ncbi:MAG: hypothetical protein Kow001_17980 [Acidobacteriota bacterium]